MLRHTGRVYPPDTERTARLTPGHITCTCATSTVAVCSRQESSSMPGWSRNMWCTNHNTTLQRDAPITTQHNTPAGAALCGKFAANVLRVAAIATNLPNFPPYAHCTLHSPDDATTGGTRWSWPPSSIVQLLPPARAASTVLLLLC